MTLAIDGVRYEDRRWDLPAGFSGTDSVVESRSRQGSLATLTWTVEGGTSYSPTPYEGVATRMGMQEYARTLSDLVTRDGDLYDTLRQRTHIDYSRHGLVRVDAGVTESVYALAATDDIVGEFGTLYLQWEETTAQYSRPAGMWVLRMYGVTERLDSVNTVQARWDDEEQFALLTRRIMEDEGTLLVQLALEDPNRVRRLSDTFIRNRAKEEYVGRMEARFHVPPTTVVKKLKQSGAFGRYSSRRNRSAARTLVRPVFFPSGKAPAMVVQTVQESQRSTVNLILGEQGMGLHQVIIPYTEAVPNVSVWVKDVETFNGRDEEILLWLNQEVKDTVSRQRTSSNSYVV